MLKCTNLRKLTLGALVLAAVGLAGRAEAACDAAGTASTNTLNPCYVLKGSDTLFDIMTMAISGARAGTITAGGVTNTFPPVAGATDLFYAGTGSGNAEKAMFYQTATGLGVQSIGPMSRNFRPSIIDPLSTAEFFVPGTASKGLCGPTSTDVACGHATWAPGVANVVGLDAAVFVAKGAGLSNIDFLTFLDTSVPTAFKKSNINNKDIAGNFGNGNGFGNVDPACATCVGAACSATCVNYNSIMSVVLSGVDGSGTIAACADPRRVQAIQDLATQLGVTTLSHLFRRDDNSGTTDTFKDRIMVVKNTSANAARYLYTGGRFCNGTAVGQISGASAQQGLCSTSRQACFANKDCTTAPAGQVCQYNLNNQDFDPIRRPCSAFDATRAPTSCTDMTTGRPCQFGDGNANCTQGFIVALSDNDPGSPDVTVSIGKRVGTTGDGSVLGYAGREAELGTGATALKINTIAPEDANVRDSTYLLARRLFIQNTYLNSVGVTADAPTDTETTNGVTGGKADQITKEQALWTQVLANRNLMDPIVRQFNFIRCATAGDGADPSQESGNLCGITPAAATPSAFSAYVPNGSFGGTCDNSAKNGSKNACMPANPSCPAGEFCSANNKGGAMSINSAGQVWNGTTAVQATAAVDSLCVGGTKTPTSGTCAGGTNNGGACTKATASADCTGGGTCAALCANAANRPSNAPCTQNSDCANGTCSNRFSHSSGGLDGLYCN